MLKTARKPSTDPIQEKLREKKAIYNKKVSEFIHNLIHFKKLMNGAPNDFYMEKSKIIDPIPSDPATIIGSLVVDFNEIVGMGNSIIRDQIEYSKSRKKKTNPNQLSLPLVASLEDKYDLVSEGSGKVSRFFTKLLNPTIGTSEAARIRKYRMSLLDSCVNTYKDLGKLQIEVVKSSKSSLNNSNKLLHEAWNDWMVVYRGYSTYKANMPKEVKDAGGEISVEEAAKDTAAKEVVKKKKYDEDDISNYNKEQFDVAQKIVDDYRIGVSSQVLVDSKPIIFNMDPMITEFVMGTLKKKSVIAPQLIKLYDKVLAKINKIYDTSELSFEQIIADIESKAPPIQVVAQDFLKKWIGKTRHELSLFDKSSVYRLDVYKMAGEIRGTINKIMDYLEKDMSIADLDPLVIQVNRDISSLRGLMRALHNAEPPAPKPTASVFDRINNVDYFGI